MMSFISRLSLRHFAFMACGLFIVAPWEESQAQVLTHGPIVGGVTSSKANVFVRTDRPANVAIRYGTTSNLSSFQVSATTGTASNHDFTAIIPLSGLSADTRLYLNVLVNGAPQLSAPFPSFTTFPSTAAPRAFKFVCISDFTKVSNLSSPVATYASAAQEAPAFCFIGGDFDHRNPTSLSTKRAMFRDLYNGASPYMGDFVREILRKMPIAHQWDDHDAGANNCDKTYANWPASQQAFEEYVPTYPLPSVDLGIWQRFSYAQVDFFVLDCRSHRDQWDLPESSSKSMLDGNALGAAGQWQWLLNGLRNSTAAWKIIFTSVVANPTTKPEEGWAAYRNEWNLLMDFIEDNDIRGVVIISGDLHMGAIDDGTHSGLPEMCVPQANGLSGCPSGSLGTWSEGYFRNPCIGYSVVTVSTEPSELLLEVKDQNGNRKLAYSILGDETPIPDSEPPGEPSDLQAQASGPATVELTWAASTDNVGVIGYDVYRDGHWIDRASTAPNYADTTALPSTSYAYYIRARDAAANQSGPSNLATADTPPDTEPPLPPATLTASATGPLSIKLTWPPAVDDAGIAGYEILRDGNLLASVNAVTSYVDNAVAPSTAYDYQLRARDVAGNWSGLSPIATATTSADTQKPSTPKNLKAVAFNSRRVDLSWTASTDNAAVVGYRIYRNDKVVATIGVATNYSDTTVSPSKTYAYKLRAVDVAGNLSSYSSQVSVTTPSTDTTPPSTPKNLVATPVEATQIGLQWKRATDNRKVIGYDIFRAGALFASIGAVTNYSDSTVLPLTTYEYRVRARDAEGNLSLLSNKTTATTPADTQPPTPPDHLHAMPMSATEVELEWEPATDNVGVTGYLISRDGSPLATLGVTFSYSDTTVEPSTVYSYEVRARDAAGNVSEPIGEMAITLADSQLLSAPTNLTLTATSAMTPVPLQGKEPAKSFTELYEMVPFVHGNHYIGFMTIHEFVNGLDHQGGGGLQFVFSNDGPHWARPEFYAARPPTKSRD